MHDANSEKITYKCIYIPIYIIFFILTLKTMICDIITEKMIGRPQ